MGEQLAIRSLLLAILLLASTNAAYAKSKSSGEDDGPYDPKGITWQGIQFLPTLEIDGIISSNAAETTPAVPDSGIKITPGLTYQSNWDTNSLSGDMSLELLAYAHNPTYDTTTGSADSTLELDLDDHTQLNIIGSYSSDRSKVGDITVPFSAQTPEIEQTLNRVVNLVHDFGQWEGTVGVGWSHTHYNDILLKTGQVVHNFDRDYSELDFSSRVAIGDSDALMKPFLEVTYTPRAHDQTIGKFSYNRNSEGYGATVGLDFGDGDVWSGKMGVAYLKRNYDDRRLNSLELIGMSGDLTWTPNDYWSVEFTGSTTIGESEALLSSGARDRSFNVAVTYSPFDDLDLTAGAGREQEDDGTGITTTWTTNLGATWKLNRNLSVGLAYDGTWFNGGGAYGQENYNEQRLTAGITLSR